MNHIPPLVIESFTNATTHVVPSGMKAKNCMQVGKGCEAIYKHTRDHCKDKNFPLILGGDHCISIGTISAIKEARKDVGIVWVSTVLVRAYNLTNPI